MPASWPVDGVIVTAVERTSQVRLRRSDNPHILLERGPLSIAPLRP
jgi:hypothetical protein